MMKEGVLAQVGKFGIVGILNTIIDFAIFNLLTSKHFKLSKIWANVVSTTVAMVFSFFANRDTVFKTDGGSAEMQAVLFFITTGFGLYVLQSGVLYFLLKRWKWPKRLVVTVLRRTGLKNRLTTDFVLKNSAKLVGTIVSLIWNFFLYKYVVFK